RRWLSSTRVRAALWARVRVCVGGQVPGSWAARYDGGCSFPGDLLLKPIVEVAGQDISHWFDRKTRDIRKHVDPLTGTLRYRTPRGRFLHVPPQLPRSDWANDFGKPWWQGVRYEVGRLSAKTRNIRIINTLTSQEHILEVRTGARRRVRGNWESQQISEEIFRPLALRSQWEQHFPSLGATEERRPPRSAGLGTGGAAGSQGTRDSLISLGQQFTHVSDGGFGSTHVCVLDSSCNRTLINVLCGRDEGRGR
uniref:Uncharacterized protein n=1 Tax=Ursus americanus TaxID=9643 RepID=A0A452QLL9_URSAM